MTNFLTESGDNTLKNIISSLQYLAHEAKGAKLDDVCLIINTAIADVDQWTSDEIIDRNIYYEKIMSSDLYKITSLIHKFSATCHFDFDQLIKAFEAYKGIEK